MTTIQLSPDCERWHVGVPTKHPPADVRFLEAVERAGFVAFVGPGGLCGAKSESRSIVVVHRGRGTKWEVVFRENEADAVATTTADLPGLTDAALSWLRGGVLTADENSLRSVAG